MLLWSIARASAFVAFGAYTVVVAWGIMLAGRAFRPAVPQVQLHRFVGLVALVALTTHIAALLLDHYSRIHVATLVGIGAGPAVLAGVIALWLVVALPLSFRLRKARIIPQVAWRRFHYLGYAAWALMLGHGVFNGHDTASPYGLAMYAGSAAIVAGCAVWRWPGQPAASARRA